MVTYKAVGGLQPANKDTVKMISASAFYLWFKFYFTFIPPLVLISILLNFSFSLLQFHPESKSILISYRKSDPKLWDTAVQLCSVARTQQHTDNV